MMEDLIGRVIVGAAIGASAAIGWIAVMWFKAQIKWRRRVRRWLALSRKIYNGQAIDRDFDEELEIWNSLSEDEKGYVVITGERLGFIRDSGKGNSKTEDNEDKTA